MLQLFILKDAMTTYVIPELLTFYLTVLTAGPGRVPGLAKYIFDFQRYIKNYKGGRRRAMGADII
jgi:hypothetical protein